LEKQVGQVIGGTMVGGALVGVGVGVANPQTVAALQGVGAAATSPTVRLNATEFTVNLALGEANGRKLNYSGRPSGVTPGAAVGYWVGFGAGVVNENKKFLGFFD
jgi:hypothetical protein